jgi:4-phytase/acid phosphatase
MKLLRSAVVLLALLHVAPGNAQSNASPASGLDNALRFVVIMSRHGVRSPTGKLDQLNRYSRQPWPTWNVPPGYLTAHGARLMTLLGTYDRALLASQGLLSPDGCADAAHIRIVADSDQRTRESGKALAAGLEPGCKVDVAARSEGTPDPLFHPLHSDMGHVDYALAFQSVAGRLGGSADGLAEAYRLQLQLLEDVLRACPSGSACTSPTISEPESLFSIPSSIQQGSGDHLVELRSPLNIASTMTENLLLEYAEGFDTANVGWGRVDLRTLRMLMQLHTAQSDVSGRASYLARAGASNLLAHLLDSMEQAAEDRPVPGALTSKDDRVLILMGHDTNITNISGALNLSWLIDGRRDDTPPGGALVFELWQNARSKAQSVRVYYVSQTLEQMRNSTSLSLANPPERVAVYLPDCSGADTSCSWSAFKQTMQRTIDTSFVR